MARASRDGRRGDARPLGHARVQVDPGGATARVDGGATWGIVDRETQRWGLAVTGGMISSTGVGGLTLGGGLGWLMGRHGLTVDSLLAAEVVVADGSVLSVSADEHPDLFWALRGGGGNFGVVSSFVFQLHPVGPLVTGVRIVYPFSQAADVLRGYRDLTAAGPDDLTVNAALTHLPDGSATRVAALVGCHLGTPAEAERDLAPLRSFATPLDVELGPMEYTIVNSLLDEAYPFGALNYWKSSFLRELSDDAIDAIVAAFGDCPSPASAFVLENLHGQVTRVPVEATAVPHRRARVQLPDHIGVARRGRHRRERRVDEGGVRRAAAVHGGPPVRELHRGRRGGRRPGAGGLRPQLRTSRRDKGSLRPRQPVPAEPERRATGHLPVSPRKVAARKRPTLSGAGRTEPPAGRPAACRSRGSPRGTANPEAVSAVAEPLSPELALICPEVRSCARIALPERPWEGPFGRALCPRPSGPDPERVTSALASEPPRLVTRTARGSVWAGSDRPRCSPARWSSSSLVRGSPQPHCNQVPFASCSQRPCRRQTWFQSSRRASWRFAPRCLPRRGRGGWHRHGCGPPLSCCSLPSRLRRGGGSPRT